MHGWAYLLILAVAVVVSGLYYSIAVEMRRGTEQDHVHISNLYFGVAASHTAFAAIYLAAVMYGRFEYGSWLWWIRSV
jgi:hypothetical protein